MLKQESLQRVAHLLTDAPDLNLQGLANQSYKKFGRGILCIHVDLLISGAYTIGNMGYVPKSDIKDFFKSFDLSYQNFLAEIVLEYPTGKGYALAVLTDGGKYASIII